MNPEIAWPGGAQPFTYLLQAHDKELLDSELLKESAL